ncbi:MAG: transglycosylase domain-containing protein [Balneolaceae bacterium]
MKFYGKKNKPLFKRPVAIGLLLLTALAAGLTVMLLLNLKSSLPDMSELREIRHHQSSRVISSDGRLLGSYFVQNRTQIDLGDVSPFFTEALISIEDARFYEHSGIDGRALMRVLVKSLLLGQDSGGGSTLTQQLAKNLFPREKGGLFSLAEDKLREMITAHRLEKLYSKDELLELYMNTVSFGEETFGIETASRRFFSKPASDLEPHEAALLAGVLKAPGFYNPHRHPERALRRRNVVLRQMETYGKITPEEAELYTEKNPDIRYRRITVNDGLAPHFREHLRMKLQQLLRRQPAIDGRYYNLYTDGLTIRTTIDSRIQSAAENAMTEQMKRIQASFEEQRRDSVLLPKNDPAILRAWRGSGHYRKLAGRNVSEEEITEIFHEPVPMKLFTPDGEIEREISPHDSLRHYLSFLNAGFLAMSPGTGEVQAWAGGINHRYFQFDHVKSRRQTGSAFKPFVYATAVENGLQPCDYHRNLLSRYEEYEEWTPRNIREEYGGYYSTQAALANSVNTISVDILMENGIENVREQAAGLGITSYIPRQPSIALGTAEVSLLEMTQAYAAFASGGKRVKPYYIKAIFDSAGRLLYNFENPNLTETVQALSPETAAAILSMLSKAVDEGTGSGLRSRFGITHAVAGKTGTTQEYTDGWFIGMTPDLVFGSWVGGRSPRIRFSQNLGYASQTALPVAGQFLKNLQKDTTLTPQPDEFHEDQRNTHFNTQCMDYRKDSALDKFRDFVTGRDANEPRRVETDEEGKNLIDRVRDLFRAD